MDKRSSIKENSIARRERLGLMILRKMDAQEIQDGIQGLEIYDDVAQEEDVRVFD